MKLYLAVIKFNWLKVLAFPFEIIAFLAGRFFALGFLALFWYAAAHSVGSAIDFRPLVAYFLVAAAVKDFTFATDLKFAQFLQRSIKSGDINNYLIKPVQTVPFLFFTYAGSNGMGIVYAFVTLIIGLIILPPASLFNVVGFIIFLGLALVISVCLNTLVGLISFYSSEGGGFRNAINHVVKILSGSLIPLYLFPPVWKSFVLSLPFANLVFSPVYVLQNQLPTRELIFMLFQGVGWSVILFLITSMIWRSALKKYEGIGI